mgnify:CR=1 FL=1
MFITNSAKLPLVVNNEPLILNAALPLLQDNRMQSASLAEVWQKLWRNKWWVILTFLGMVLLTAYITFNINFKICKSLPYGNLPASFLLLHNLLQNQGCNLHLRFRKVSGNKRLNRDLFSKH